MDSDYDPADAPQHRCVTVTILDTVTGETRKDSRHTPWFWAFGNGDCDCNRSLVFDPDLEEIECGEWRYYIIAVEGDETGYVIGEDYNHGYPPLPPAERPS